MRCTKNHWGECTYLSGIVVRGGNIAISISWKGSELLPLSIWIRLQQKVFMDEVRQQTMLPTIRSYLKLYTSMPMDKLAKYMGTDAEDYKVDALEGNLLCFKHKMMNLVWTKGTSGLEGEFQAESEVSQIKNANL